MEEYPIYNLSQEMITQYFGELPQKPKQLFIRGTFPHDPHLIFLTIVGSRNCSSYGKEVCKFLISGLRGYPIVIVSGLANGIDRTAHEVALDTGLPIIAFPGSGLDDATLYPRENVSLAYKILCAGGALISEYPSYTKGNVWTFPQRNRLMAGLSKATLLIEGINESGSRITARLATEYNRDVGAVPGSIFSETSEAPHELIKLGATPITNPSDLLELLGFYPEKQPALEIFKNCTHEEQSVLKLLIEPLSRDELIRKTTLSTHKINILISQMEIRGLIQHHDGIVRRL